MAYFYRLQKCVANHLLVFVLIAHPYSFMKAVCRSNTSFLTCPFSNVTRVCNLSYLPYNAEVVFCFPSSLFSTEVNEVME